MNDVLYDLAGVTKMYDGRSVLTIDHLQIYRGEVLGLVGPSGAGKSTLLRLLNFLEPPTIGRLRFHDQPFTPDVAMPLALRRRVTTVFQRPFLLRRTVRANVGYGLRLRGQHNGDDQIAAVLNEVGLSDLADQPAHTLSGGEAQRVALARAMVLEPEVLLLDEPTANLDPYNVGLIEGIIHQLNQTRGTTLVVVTHNIFQARRLAQRVGLMLNGRFVEISDVDTFFTAPTDPRTAAFVQGDMVY